MKFIDRRKPYRVGLNWRIEYPQDDDQTIRNNRWTRHYSLWRFDTLMRRWLFWRFIDKAEADCYGRRPTYV